jgi:hypothetical protein
VTTQPANHGRRNQPINMNSTIAIEKITINGLVFNVLQSMNADQVEAAGRANTASEMRKNGLVRELVATRGNGTRLYMINEFKNGNYRGWEKSVA